MKQITVLLADDHDVVREGLAALLRDESDIRVVGLAATGIEAVELATRLHPDVVVMDIAMPALNGVDATQQIRQVSPRTRVLVLSAYSNPACIEQVFAKGATGYLVKKSSVSILAQAIRAIDKGERVTDPSIRVPTDSKPKVVFTGGPRNVRGEVALTPRENDVLKLIAEGLINKQVAAALGISSKTSEKHRYSIMGKLGIHDTAGLTQYAVALGMTDRSQTTPA